MQLLEDLRAKVRSVTSHRYVDGAIAAYSGVPAQEREA
jgi:hypothetical protein